MSEAFLHYIWLHQYFDRSALRTQAGEEILVHKPGLLNTHAGPDFSGAKITIGSLQWVGQVEVHIKSSDWAHHRHQTDQAYENVILHVVWQDDRPVQRSDGTSIPTLVLQGRVDEKLLRDFRKLINSGQSIPCSSQLRSVPSLIRHAMLDRALAQRLEKKGAEVLALLRSNTGDWEETAYQLLARNMGFKVNADPFFQLAKNLPIKILRKHQNSPVQVEALLFGQAGFLMARTQDPYVQTLHKEFFFLAKKYRLEEKIMSSSQWKFLRLRPANFPTVRLAQLAALLPTLPSLFSFLVEVSDIRALKDRVSVSPSAYWQTHYRFGVKAAAANVRMGEDSVVNIAINTVAPLLAAYSQHTDDQTYLDRALEWLPQLRAESNRITRLWAQAGLRAQHAFDSQAQLELYHHFCLQRHCLNCAIGGYLLKPV
ncbi:MAG: DUF2851 family protein [Cyclobacteriaceae bacterium]|jgi:hypothetical protein|nr:DUF2851 family protein [Cyclobacteriaceae bacterium]